MRDRTHGFLAQQPTEVKKIEATLADYYFDSFDSPLRRDTIGIERTDQVNIHHEAMRVLPEVAKGEIPKDGQQQAYAVHVRNERNITVYTATLSFAGIWLGDDIPHPDEQFD